MIKRGKWIFLVLGCVVLFIFSARFVYINLKYPPSEKSLVPARQTVEYQKSEFKVLSSEWIDVSSLSDGDEMKEAVYAAYSHPRETKTLAMVIEFELFNPTDERIVVDMSTTNLESGNYSRPLGDLAGFFDCGGVAISLEAGERRICKVLQPFYESEFSKKQWEDLTEREFYFVISLYPEKQMALIPANPI